MAVYASAKPSACLLRDSRRAPGRWPGVPRDATPGFGHPGAL